MGLRIDPVATRRRIRDAVAGDRIPGLGAAPNMFGTGIHILGFAQDALREQTDRYRIAQATPKGWVSNVTGTGQVLRLATRDTTFVHEPWGVWPWVFPGDAQITINGAPVLIDDGAALGWSQLGQQLTVGLVIAGGATVTQHPSDTVTVTIPDADWLTGYLDGDRHVRLLHRDGATYYRYDGVGDAWEPVTPVRLVDAEIWPDRPPDSQGPWVRFGEIAQIIDTRVFTGRPVGYSADVTITIQIGSGVNHASPDEADEAAYRTLGQVLDVIAGLDRLPDTGRATPTGTSTVQGWGDDDDRETIIELAVVVTSR